MNTGTNSAFRALGKTLAKQGDKVAAARIEQMQWVNGKTGADMTEANRMLMHENLRLKQEVERLTTLLAEAQAAADGIALAAQLEKSGRSLPFVNNRPVMTQTQYADFHRMSPYQVHRWIHGYRNENKKTGAVTYSNPKLQSVKLDGVWMVYADQPPPATGWGVDSPDKRKGLKRVKLFSP